MRRTMRLIAVLFWSASLVRGAVDPPLAPNTQKPGDEPASPQMALTQVRVPEGFKVTLFAGEPDIRQPVGFTFDDRGRLWVIECYSYPEWKAPDRVLIFEDTDHDGRFDSRKVFLEGGHKLTGIEIGFGGVWLCSAPNLTFIPCKGGDDVPSGPPVVMLDGWNSKEAHHNIFNGLSWGPDGWLYGTQGILAESAVGKPGAPPEQRVRMNCGVWRYHPTSEAFEVVAHGTTNPWGLDWNDVGEAFFANCVIGHLWQLIPGAHYERMFGHDYDPYLFGLIGATSDHLHWGGGHWTGSRGGEGKHDLAGGGHAHCGAMVYLGNNWPASYRDTFFTVNIHGRRLNNDILERSGSGYVGKHAKDCAFWGDSWFRGVAAKYGPDGGVYVLDWSDLGECHDSDGVHRSSGRIYKITYGTPSPPRIADVSKLSDSELVALLKDPNDWHVRHARRRLQELERAPSSRAALHAELWQFFKSAHDSRVRLRALWALHAVRGLDPTAVSDLLKDDEEHVRAWAVRLSLDMGASEELMNSLEPRVAALAAHDPSPVVRLAVAAALQRMAPGRRIECLRALLSHGEDAEDHNLPLMIWYATEPLVLLDVPRALDLAMQSKFPLVTRFIFRRVACDEKGIETLLATLGKLRDDGLRLVILKEISEAMQGRANVPMPKGWPVVRPDLLKSPNREVVGETESLSVTFGDREILPLMRELLTDNKAAIPDRQRAMELLVRARDPELTRILPTLMTLLPDLRAPALRAMATFGDVKTPEVILSRHRYLTRPERQDAIGTLVSRLAFASALLDAMQAGIVSRQDVSAYHVRQILGFNDARLAARIEKLWGSVRQTSKEKGQQLAHYRSLLSRKYLESADLSNGRAVFSRTCMPCHVLFDVGGKIGPDLTGSNRANLDYILENVLDPSAIVGKDYQFSIFEMRDGQFVGGVVHGETDSAVTVQTQTEQLVLPKSDIKERRLSELSMMPEEMFAGLKNEEIRDLIAYLASPGQVPLPEEGK